MNNKIKTIDELVEHYRPGCALNTQEDSCRFIVYYHLNHLLNVLKLDSNKPSKHDIRIISWINSDIKYPKNLNSNSYRDLTDILTIYKNRKES